METDLKSLFLDHQGKISDKWTLYLDEWDNIFSPYKDLEIDILEIGIQNGGSLEIWAKYFKNSNHIVGCDIDQSCLELEYEDPRISIIVGDANTGNIETQILETSEKFDIIIDDGSHTSADVIKSFTRYFKHLNENGIYVIEDLHTSYWNDFGGGLYTPYSSMAFLKRLADVINFEHWRIAEKRTDFLSQYARKYNLSIDEFDLCRIHSLKFYNSLCIIKKKSPENNSLGTRVISGTEEKITNDWQKLNGTSILDFVSSIKDDSYLSVFSLLHQIQLLEEEIQKQDQIIKNLNLILEEKEQEVLYYALSKSWKITRPFRKLMGLFKKNNDT